MCGISGAIGNIKKNEKYIYKMSNELVHRGPDLKLSVKIDKVIFNHNRLSIIDLTKNGSQPMNSLNGRYSMIYNGEIYNYLEILENLDLQGTNYGDTRALIELFSKKKIKCLEYLRGMFAFAIYDRKYKRTYLIRDRFGIKPLYYHYSYRDKIFYFSSEIKPLLKFQKYKNYDQDVINDYLTHSLLDHSKKTFFKDIFQIMPGEYLEVNSKGQIVKSVKWYDLKKKINPVGEKKNKKFQEEYNHLLRETIKIHTRSDVKVGISLSGGLDSQTILSEYLKNNYQSNIYSYNFYFSNKKYSERSTVEKFLKNKNIKNNYILLNTDFFPNFQKMIDIQEQPYGGIATISMQSLYKKAKKDGLKVLLNGTGADDSLAGSNREILVYLLQLLNSKQYNKLNNQINYYSKFYKLSKNNIISKLKYLKENFSNFGADGSLLNSSNFLKKKFDVRIKNNLEINLRSILVDRISRNKIPRNLRYEDRNSMSNSIEVRVPFLDHKLVEYSLNLPEKLIIDKSIGKIALRNFMKKDFNYKNAFKIKKSIQTPQIEWLLKNKNKKIIIDLLKKKNSFISTFIDVKKAHDFVNSEKFYKIKNSNFIWQWLSLETWYEKFF